jgi:hypothetical protein
MQALTRPCPGSGVEDFAGKDLLQHIDWRESFSARFHLAGKRAKWLAAKCSATPYLMQGLLLTTSARKLI